MPGGGFTLQYSSTSGPRDVYSGAGSAAARFAGHFGFAGVPARTATHHIANAAQYSLNFLVIAVGTFHLGCVIFANSKKLETMIAGKTAKFINRHIYPPSPGIPGLNIYPTLIQSEPVVKWLQVVAQIQFQPKKCLGIGRTEPQRAISAQRKTTQ
jgi:hypothetical protein